MFQQQQGQQQQGIKMQHAVLTIFIGSIALLVLLSFAFRGHIQF